ncbi:DNA polymerase delta subunit 3 [Seiridium cupressi]
MDDYRKYLAQQVLTEDKVVTYRLLSRALKVHVNAAKEMLYDFHKWQNDKRPGMIHATYLVYGTRKKLAEADGDVEMADSQSESGVPFSDEVPISTLMLARGEQLQGDLSPSILFRITLAPHPLKDLQLLTEPAQSVTRMTLEGGLSSAGKVYGSIANPGMRKRERKGGASRPASAAPNVNAETKPQVKPETKPEVKEVPTASKAAPAKETKAATTAAAKKGAAPSLKRQGSSAGISQMFAKAAAKPKKTASRPTSNTPSATDTPSPALSDEGEDDSEMPDVKPDVAAGQARKSRRDELRRMMEESDEETESKPQTPTEEPEEEEPAAEPDLKADEGPAEVVSSTGDGRKRGRRRVTKKKQMMDDQGYLVTVQEQAWESFSEDEAPPPSKPKVEKADKQAPAAKGKKGAAKGQGNIMSFFSKK